MCFFEKKIDQTQDYREEPNVKKKSDSNIQCSLKKSVSDHVMFIEKNWLIKHETIVKRKSLTMMFIEKKKSDSDHVMFLDKNWLIKQETIVKRKSLTLRRRVTQKAIDLYTLEDLQLSGLRFHCTPQHSINQWH